MQGSSFLLQIRDTKELLTEIYWNLHPFTSFPQQFRIKSYLAAVSLAQL